MKDYLTARLSEPSTWRGIINTIAGSSGFITYFVDKSNPLLAIYVAGGFWSGAFVLSGIIGLMTSDYKNTETKADDILNAAATAMRSKAEEKKAK